MIAIPKWWQPPRIAEARKNYIAGWWIQRTFVLSGFGLLIGAALWVLLWFGFYSWQLAFSGQDIRAVVLENHHLRVAGRYGSHSEFFQTVRLEDGRIAHLSISPCPGTNLTPGTEIPLRWLDAPEESWFRETRTLSGHEQSVQRAVWLPENGSSPTIVDYVSRQGMVMLGLFGVVLLVVCFSPRMERAKRKSKRKRKKRT